MNQNSKRIYYLDRIKILLCILVIGLHTTIAYGGTEIGSLKKRYMMF